MNCTRVKSLVEPFIREPFDHQLLNPSLGSQKLNVTTLEPASQYNCTLIGAITLNLGADEKLIVLSEQLSFATELGKLALITMAFGTV